MSYCRWSTNDYKCDLYCYEDCGGGYTTHVACYKRTEEGEIGEPIGLKFDGETFNDETLQEFKSRLLSLRAEGYSFPDYVLEDIDEEIAASRIAPKLTKGGV